MTTDLSSTAARGGGVTVAGQVVKLLLLLANIVILGRLLAPEDFGIVAMVMTIVGIAELLRDFGLSSAAIQASQLLKEQKSNLFWLNTGLGLVWSLITVAIAGQIALFYGDPRIEGITIAIAPIFLLNGIQTQFQVELTRSFRFNSLVVTDITAQLVGLIVGIISAAAGADYWALIYMQLSIAVLMCLLRVLSAPWKPSRPRRGFGMRPFLRFGWNLGVAQILNYISSNSPVLILGAVFGASLTGYFSRAFQIASVPINQFFGPLTAVALPTLSSINDHQKYANAVRRLQLVVTYPAALGFSLLITIAPYFVEILLGPNWVPSAIFVQILAVGISFQALTFVGFWIFLSKSLTDDLLRYNIVTKGIVVGLTALGGSFGPEGVVAGYSAGLLLSWPISLVWLSRTTRLSVLPLFAGGCRAVAISAAACTSGLWILAIFGAHGPYLGLGLGVTGWALGAILTAVFLRPIRRDIFVVASELRRVFVGKGR